MLAVGTQMPSANNKEIAILDFDVSNMGRLAQAPDNLQLDVIQPPSHDGLTVCERLQRISELEQILTTLNQDISNLTAAIATLNQIDDILNAQLSTKDHQRLEHHFLSPQSLLHQTRHIGR
jgi:CheY-like chemotaxis protein